MTDVGGPLCSEDGVTMASVTVQGVENVLLKVLADKLGLHHVGLFFI